MMGQSFRGETNGGFKLFGGVGDDEEAGVLLGRDLAGVFDRERKAGPRRIKHPQDRHAGDLDTGMNFI
jgi:hypothetical protein